MRGQLASALLAITLAACGDGNGDLGQARTEPGGARDATVEVAPTSRDADEGAVEPPPAPPPDDEVLAEGAPAGTIPAWQAVVDRDRYLARRGQKGTITGRLGAEAIAPGAKGVVRWLIDETEGNGALAVRVGITGPVPAEGTRLAARGAWALDDQRRWYWQVESLAPLDTPAPAPPVEPPAPPGHQIASGPPPRPYRPASKPQDGGVIVFGVIRAAPAPGAGWLIGDDSFSPPAATLLLPGERSSYGGHDLRQADEVWELKRGVLYWVRIERVRRRTPDALPTIRAVTAPVKVQ
ncbi:MAG TPA: hypothetical protein VM734_35600 [Kofleriaceae bacterium]|nr:hypothetical protein [Kofleriaceae bacterium]